jgi:hypothetical protein
LLLVSIFYVKLGCVHSLPPFRSKKNHFAEFNNLELLNSEPALVAALAIRNFSEDNRVKKYSPAEGFSKRLDYALSKLRPAAGFE